MRQRIWRRLFAAAIGLIAAGGTASAQYQTAAPPLAPPAALTPVVIPVETATQPSVPAAVAGTPIAPGKDAVIYAQAAPPGAPVAPVPHTPIWAPPPKGPPGYFMSGPDTPTRLGSGVNGCGSCKQDAAFVFGPCKSYFAPCGNIANGGHFGSHGGRGGHGGGCGCGIGGGGLGGHGGGLGAWAAGCATPVYGTGRATGFNTCHYDSYLNH